MYLIDDVACIAGMLGILTTALSEKWYGWAIGTFASLCWATHGLLTHQYALLVSGAFFSISQAIGVYRRFKRRHHHSVHHRPVAYKFKGDKE